MSHLNVAEWTAITLEGKRWDWDADIWKTNVVQKNIWDDSIVSGAECCAICRAKYPASRGWQKFRYYTQCECMIYPPTFSPLYSLVRDHGAYDIGTCKEPSSAYNSSVQPNTAQSNLKGRTSYCLKLFSCEGFQKYQPIQLKGSPI